MLLLALTRALCAHRKENGEAFRREIFVGNGALEAGTLLRSCLRPSAAPPSPSAPSEAKAEGSRGRVTHTYPQLSLSWAVPISEMGSDEAAGGQSPLQRPGHLL